MTDITKFKSIKDVPSEMIHDKSKDGKTLVLVDGTKVSDKLIEEARAKPRKKAATETPGAPFDKVALLNDRDFKAAVREIVEEAGESINRNSVEAAKMVAAETARSVIEELKAPK